MPEIMSDAWLRELDRNSLRTEYEGPSIKWPIDKLEDTHDRRAGSTSIRPQDKIFQSIKHKVQKRPSRALRMRWMK